MTALEQVTALTAVAENQPNALENHVAFFADNKGVLSFASIRDGMQKLKSSGFSSFMTATAVTGAMNIAVTGCPFTSRTMTLGDAHKIVHPCDSGVFNKDGTFSAEAFEKLKGYAQPGKEFLSELDITKMCQEAAERDKAASLVWFYTFVSSGEWSLLLTLGCDHYEMIDAKPVQCITFDNLLLFFTKGREFFEKIEEGLLPVAPPSIEEAAKPTVDTIV